MILSITILKVNVVYADYLIFSLSSWVLLCWESQRWAYHSESLCLVSQFCIVTLSVILSSVIMPNVVMQVGRYAECGYAGCRYAECCGVKFAQKWKTNFQGFNFCREWCHSRMPQTNLIKTFWCSKLERFRPCLTFTARAWSGARLGNFQPHLKCIEKDKENFIKTFCVIS